MSTTEPLLPQTSDFPLVLPLEQHLGRSPDQSQHIGVTEDVATIRTAGQGSEPKTSGPRPATKSTRYLSLDLWRGAACLMLVFYHSTFYGDYHFRISDPSTWTLAGLPLYLVRYCWVGVPIFFVISGYCISASVDSLRRRPHSIRDYFLRRFRRIYPPLWIMCGLAVIITFAASYWPMLYASCQQLPRPFEFTFGQWAGNVLAFESWRHNIAGGKPTYLMGNTWTLCYEEQFYFLAGVMLALSSSRFFKMAAWLTATVFVGRLVLRAFGVTHEGLFWDGHWILFAAGIFVYHTLNHVPTQKRWPRFLLLFAAAMYGAAERVLNDDPFQKHLGEYLLIASAFGLFLLAARRWDAWIASRKIFAPLKWCGQRSYSIYLTHFLLVTMLSSYLAQLGLKSELLVAVLVVPVCLAVTIPVAILFYKLVETRFVNAPLDTRVA